MKIHNKRELQSIAINHSADIDYKDFMKIYRTFTNKPYSFLTIDTALPVDNSLKFRKKSFFIFYKNDYRIIKMTLTDEIKVLDDKIKAN